MFKEGGWFALSEDMWTWWREPGQKREKVRMVSDANFPVQLVEAMKRRGIAVKTAQELGLAKLPDDELLRKVTERGDVLITMDRDFGPMESFRFTNEEQSFLWTARMRASQGQTGSSC